MTLLIVRVRDVGLEVVGGNLISGTTKMKRNSSQYQRVVKGKSQGGKGGRGGGCHNSTEKTKPFPLLNTKGGADPGYFLGGGAPLRNGVTAD